MSQGPHEPPANMPLYSVSTDRQRRMDGRSRIWDERSNRYLTDPSGTVLVFDTPAEAQQWLDRDWLRRIGVRV